MTYYKVLLLITLSYFYAGSSIRIQAQEITLEDIWEKNTFATKQVQGFKFLSDGFSFTRLVNNKIIKYDIQSGNENQIIFNAAEDAGGSLQDKIQSYTFSRDENKLLFETASESIYRYSSVGVYYVYNKQTKTLTNIFSQAKIMYPSFNPTGDKLAFIFDNNIFIQDLNTQRVTQITKDGKKNNLINGASDWVYEEEFTLTRAYEWSPTGDQIGFIKFDERNVKEFYLEYYKNEAYPIPYQFKYPKVGEENSKVSAWTYQLKSKKLKMLSFGTSEGDDFYLPRIQWTSSNQELCITWMNRHQNHLKLILANTQNNTYKIILEEKNKYYIDIHDNLKFLDDGKGFIWTSEKDGYNHVYLHSLADQPIKQLTSGSNEITEFYGMDKSRSLYFVQKSENLGLERKIYGVKLDGTARCITNVPGVHNAQMSTDANYFVITSSDIQTPPTIKIVNQMGSDVRIIEENGALKKKLADYELPDVELMQLKNSSGISLNAAMIKPKNFDENKKYPVFMYLYGGPGSQEVLNKWNSFRYFWWFQMLAQKGYIVCIADNRGTGGRGEEFKKMTYLQLGKYETEDQIDVAKYLATQKYVDEKRLGIFGWSYGGYLSSLCLLKGNDVFKAAIAVAPVTNWKWYDNIYTERFMKTEKENPSGYQDNSPVNFADRLQGNYLLIHGIADDNVHFQNSAEMINALVKHKKQFESFVYPNRNHNISGDQARIHLFTKITQFILEKI
ncbi:MAG: S9 family peptidase [Bacteroidota bacterium]|nr:S9 family peptidase [Bacteroidota bacterium]